MDGSHVSIWLTQSILPWEIQRFLSQKDMLDCPKSLLHECLEVIVCLDYQRLRLCGRGLAVA